MLPELAGRHKPGGSPRATALDDVRLPDEDPAHDTVVIATGEAPWLEFIGALAILVNGLDQVLVPGPSGGSCLSGAAISNGTIYWGSGYTSLGGTANNKLFALGVK